MTAVPELRTQRLVLRGWRDGDLDAFAAMQADPQVAEWLGGTPQARDDAWRTMALFAGHWVLKGCGQWVLEDRDSGGFVGRAGLWCPEGWPGVEVGWALVSHSWGQGLATEAGAAALAWAFDQLGLDQVVSVTLPGNTRSRAVMERLGLTYRRDIELRGHRQVLYAAERPR